MLALYHVPICSFCGLSYSFLSFTNVNGGWTVRSSGMMEISNQSVRKELADFYWGASREPAKIKYDADATGRLTCKVVAEGLGGGGWEVVEKPI